MYVKVKYIVNGHKTEQLTPCTDILKEELEDGEMRVELMKKDEIPAIYILGKDVNAEFYVMNETGKTIDYFAWAPAEEAKG